MTDTEETTEVEQTYEDRHISLEKISKIHGEEDTFGSSLTMESGWSMGFPADQAHKIEVGDHFILEKKGFNRISGFMLLSLMGGEWIWHHSDQDIKAQEDEWAAKDRKRREEFLAENRENMVDRQLMLPQVLQNRLQNFHDNGGIEFELKGWGYELIVCELIVLYAASGGEESDEITAFATEHGTSGNQHDYAKSAAKLMGTDREGELAGSVSALTPITGDPYFADATDD